MFGFIYLFYFFGWKLSVKHGLSLPDHKTIVEENGSDDTPSYQTPFTFNIFHNLIISSQWNNESKLSWKRSI